MKGIVIMQIYEIQHIIDNDEWEIKFTELAKRCESLNGWSEKDLLQFAVINVPMYKIWLIYLEDFIIDLEKTQKAPKFMSNLFKKGIQNDNK